VLDEFEGLPAGFRLVKFTDLWQGRQQRLQAVPRAGLIIDDQDL
jgi:hypothetical protein